MSDLTSDTQQAPEPAASPASAPAAEPEFDNGFAEKPAPSNDGNSDSGSDSDSGSTDLFNDIMSTFGAAPAKPAPTPAAEPAQVEAPAAPAPQPASTSAPNAQPAPAATTPAAPDAPAPAAPALTPEATLRLEVEGLKAQLARQNGQPVETAPPADASTPPAPKAAPYQLAIPQQVQAALFGDDPNQAGLAMNHIVSSLADRLMADVHGLLDTRLNGLVENMQAQRNSQEAEQQAADQRETYFKKFENHRNPLFQPVIAEQAAALMMENPNSVWDENFMNALGTRVNTALQGYGVAQAAPAPATPPAPLPTPAPMLPQGARGHSDPAAVPSGTDLVDEIEQTFSSTFG